jgi:hypothetical protein
MRGELVGVIRAFGVFVGHLLLFPCQPSECSAIHLTASCSVIKPLITSVSPSSQRISTTQPDRGFFRATKVGRCSDILGICAYGAPVQAGIVCPRKIVD